MTQRPHHAAVAIPMPTARFPRTARVRARSEYDRIFKHGRRVALPVLALHWQPDGGGDGNARPPGGPRLGLAVSRKVDRRAVGRNRIKRVLREAFRARRSELLAGDYVLVARPGAAALDAPALQRAFLALLRRAAALPAPDPDGTMPAPRLAGTPPIDPPSPRHRG